MFTDTESYQQTSFFGADQFDQIPLSEGEYNIRKKKIWREQLLE
ncbi:MAG: hypothetical protein WCY88_06575 [Spongiibacteraceae bacterium]